MGADRPQIKKKNAKTQTALLLLLIGVFVLLVIAALLTYKQEDETPALQPKEKVRLEKRLREIDDGQQYALIADEDGWYPCNHPGRVAFYLLPGQVWKYGTTTKGQFGRYSVKYLEEMKVSYVIQFQGTIGECLKEEQRKLFNYPYLPENLARPKKDRLPRPPFNSKMQ